MIHLFVLLCLAFCLIRASSVTAMVFSDYTKQRILSLHWQGRKVSAIVEHLVLEDGIRVSKVGVRRFIKRYNTRGTIARQPGSGFPPKITPRIQAIIEVAMREDDETTATQLQSRLATYGVYVSLATILRSRQMLGWVYRGSAYCQLIRTVNKQKDLNGHVHTYMTILKMLFGVMRPQCSCKPTDDFVAGRRENSHV